MLRITCARAATSQGESSFIHVLSNLRLVSNSKRLLNTDAKRVNNYDSHPLLDSFGRFHDYLRVSLTERCNLRCDYCMPSNGVELSPNENLLSTEELLLVIKVFVGLGVRKVRLTGGEPTLRKDIVQLCSQIKALGVETLAITTNGLLLSRLAPQLKASGVSHLNVSLDTLDPVRFEKITKRRGHNLVMTGLDMALKQQFESIKINCVVQRGVNQDELPAFVQLTRSLPIEIRFLEHMPFTKNNWDKTSMVTYEEMVHTIKDCFPSFTKVSKEDHDPHSTARMWHVPSFEGRIGFMTTMTDEFCASCNRLRLTADGNIKACLFNNAELSIRDALRKPGASDSDIVAIITGAVKSKKEKLGGFKSSSQLVNANNRPMVLIGVGRVCLAKASIEYNQSSQLFSTTTKQPLSHLSEQGDPRMVDVSQKQVTSRIARAQARMHLPSATVETMKTIQNEKGSVLHTAIIGGIMAAKKTPELIPLCHSVPLSKVEIEINMPKEDTLLIDCLAKATHTTGVEMEALVGATVASLVVYDMLKASSHGIVIESVRLLEKSGGKQDFVVNKPT